MQLYKTERMGWGVKALEAIPKGAPVAVYASQAHWDAKDASEYSFIQTAAGGKKSSKVVLESKKFGSIARFFNHRCHGETLRPVRFMSEHSDRVNGGEGIVFVAKRNVRAGEELCFSYAPGAFKEEKGGCQCDHCVNKTDSSPQPISGTRDRKKKRM
jgi:euchromatic histone-lysine N-methyltransferase